MDIETYLREQTQLSIRQLAIQAGLNHSTLARQFKGERTLTLETLRDISLATDLDFLDLAIRAGLITEEHATKIRAKGALEQADSQDILDELARRLKQEEELENAPAPFRPLTPVPQLSPSGHPLTPDGHEFRPDLYQDHKYLWDTYGNSWYENYEAVAAMDAERAYER